MDHKVVAAVCAGLPGRGIAAFSFNFRGVGRSRGRYGNGVGERKDVAAALRFVASDAAVDASRLGLAGYSFGAGVACAVATPRRKVKALALISPWLEGEDWDRVRVWSGPRLLIWGSLDEFVIRGYERLARRMGIEGCQVIEMADHFWAGHEEELVERVSDFFAKALEV
jgi:hypothetical protein